MPKKQQRSRSDGAVNSLLIFKSSIELVLRSSHCCRPNSDNETHWDRLTKVTKTQSRAPCLRLSSVTKFFS